MDARIGFDHYTIAHRGFTPEATLRFAQAHRLRWRPVPRPAASIDGSLDAGVLADFRRRGGRAWASISRRGSPRPIPAAARASSAAWSRRARWPAWLVPHVDALAALGCRQARAYVGDRHDRFRTDASWSDQLDASLEVIRRCPPGSRRRASVWAIETHADFTAVRAAGIPRTPRPRDRRSDPRHGEPGDAAR